MATDHSSTDAGSPESALDRRTDLAVAIGYIGMVRRTTNPKFARWYGGVSLRIGRAEFVAWAWPLYRQFLRDNPGESPSVDRIDSKGDYEFSNIQIISLRENRRRRNHFLNDRAPDGHHWCTGCKAYLPKDRFYRGKARPSNPDGTRERCVECDKAAQKTPQRRRKGRENYRRLTGTPEGSARFAWLRLLRRANDSGVAVEMTAGEFTAWAIEEYARWFAERPGESPAVVRIDRDRPYRPDNLMMVTDAEANAATSRAVNASLPPGQKLCGRCKLVKPFSAFKAVKPGRAGTFGLDGWCIECRREYERDRSKRRNR